MSNGFHKFLDLIGIVSRDEPVSGRNERVGSSRGRYDDGGGDFSDENAGYDPPNVSRSERASSVDRYHGSTMSSSRMADYDEVGNMVEFKTNHQPYGQSAPGEYRQKTVIHYLRDINDCKDIIDDLLNECQVVLNIEDADDVLKQRAIDMIYGAPVCATCQDAPGIALHFHNRATERRSGSDRQPAHGRRLCIECPQF